LFLGASGIGVIEPGPFEVWGVILLLLYLATDKFRETPRTLLVCAVFIAASFGAVLLNIARVPADLMARHAMTTTALVLCALGYAQHLRRVTETEIAITVFVLTIIAVVGIVLNDALTDLFDTRLDVGRISGFQKDANVFGAGCIWIVALGLALACSVRGIAKGVLWYGVAALGLLGIYVSGSRGSVIGVLVAVGVVLACASYARVSGRALAVAGALSAIFGVVALVKGGGVSWEDTVWATRTGLQEYDTDRFLYQSRAALGILENPLGSGPNASMYIWGHSIHNSYLQVVFERGWIAFVAWIALITAGVGALARYLKRRGSRVRGRDAGHWAIATAALGVLVAIMVQALVVDVLHWRSLWLCLACSLTASTWVRSGSSELAPERALAEPAQG
jgi:hypothetical protein